MLPVWLTDTVTSDLGRALHYTLLWGLQGVELRTVGGEGDRVPQVNVSQIRDRLKADEMLPAAVNPSMFAGPAHRRAMWLNELATFDETLRMCRQIDCPRVVVSSFAGGSIDEVASEGAVQALQRAGDAASEYGVTIAVLNEVGMAHPTGAALAALLDAVDHPFVQAAWHPAQALQAGEDPPEGLEALGDRVVLVRCSDGRRTPDGWVEEPFDDGDINWEEHIQALQAMGYQGPLSLEMNVEPRPTIGLHSATRLIRLIRAARRAA
jgi:sugar phosphate isomerase/epimerase